MSKKIHLIGIGGIGMSAIAKLLLCRNFQVSGSDVKSSATTEELVRLGARVSLIHSSDNIEGVDMVIYSSAIRDENPELKEARKRNIPVLKRAQALAELMEDKTVITVAGSHGKTTTTSLVSCLLMEAGLEPTVAIGGILHNIDTNACLGKGKFFVAEADESDGSFLYYRPHYSIITNIDREHLDYYGTLEHELKAFSDFVSKTRDGGCVVVNADDANLMGLMSAYKGKYRTYGFSPSASVRAERITLDGLTSTFEVYAGETHVAGIHLSVGGMHNISNALAVITLGLELGVSPDCMQRSLSGYKGAGRRIEIKYRADDITVIDDYAHHPTELKATLAAVRNLPCKRLIAVFQPHRFTRTQALLDDFAASFKDADEVIITDIYAASELPIEGVTGESIAEKIKLYDPQRRVKFLSKDKIVGYLLGHYKPHDCFLMLGAGDITKQSHDFVQALKAAH